MAARLDVQFIELTLRHVWGISRGTVTAKRIAVARVEWEGLVGWGEASPTSRYREDADTAAAALARLRPALEGDPRAFRAVTDRLDALVEGEFGAKAALDMAIHDLAGKALGVPVYRLFGLDPAAMPLTSFSIGIDEPARVAEKVREAEGHPILKVKLGSKDDRALFEAVRGVTDKPVRVDANEGWPDPAEALRQIEWLAARGVEFVEQPLPAADLDGARWLRARSPLPVVADEAVLRSVDLPRLADAYHGINIKLMKCGGLQEAMRMIAVARAHGLKIMLGCMIESGLGIAAAAHLAPLVDWVDLDGNLLLASDPFPGHPVEGGRIRLRDAPGLGVAPAPGVLAS